MTSAIEHAFLPTFNAEPEFSDTNWRLRRQQRVFLRKAVAFFAREAI
jgi:hypothetical protein